jgi:subtilisin
MALKIYSKYDDGQHLWGWLKRQWKKLWRGKSETRHPDYKLVDVTSTLKNERLDWGIKKTDVPNIWSHSMGKGVKVAVLDSGCDLNHIDLKAGIKDFADFTGGGSARDRNGHGTHVAGIIGARAQGMGIAGVAPECDLYIGKVLGDDGSGSMYMITRAIDWCIDKGVDVINMSLGAQGPHNGVHQAIRRAHRAGITVVCASGNDGVDKLNEVDWPGRYEECIAVGAIRADMNLAAFTSMGPSVDILAPGANVYSTYLNNSYAMLSGTSMATPFVSGVVALMVGHYRETKTPYKPDKLRLELMKNASRKIEWNDKGYGIIDPDAFL